MSATMHNLLTVILAGILAGPPYRRSYPAKTAVVLPICVVASTVIAAPVMPIAAQGAKLALVCTATPGASTPTDVSVSDIVTDEFFNGIIDQAADSCAGKGFYTRSVFLQAADSYPSFGREGSIDVSKREIAAAFAHFRHEIGNFCYIEEIYGPSKDYCDESNTQYPCVAGKGYYGRGPIQLSWNFNYGPAGKSIGFDGLNNPDLVATDPVIAFKTALWYWMNFVHLIIVSGQGFGETIQAINGALECNGGNPETVSARVGYYTEYCNQLGVTPGDNLYC